MELNDEYIEGEEEGYGPVADISISLEFKRVVETAPQAENLRDTSQRLFESIKEIITSEFDDDWSVTIIGSGNVFDGSNDAEWNWSGRDLTNLDGTTT